MIFANWPHRILLILLIIVIVPNGAAIAEELWGTVKTEHFEILYPAALLGLAQESAEIAEEAHRYWREHFGYELRGVTYIELQDSGDVTHANSVVYPHNKISIDHPYGSAFALERRADESLLHYLIFREYGRIYNLSRVEGFNMDLQFVFGEIILPEMIRPLLEREGYSTLDLIDEAYLRMILYGELLDERIPSASALSAPFRSELLPHSTLQASIFGAAYLSFLRENEDSSTLQEMHRLTAMFPLSSATIGALELVAGKSLTETYNNFLEIQLAQFEAKLKNYEPPPDLRPLSSANVQAFDPSWSPDAFALVYGAEDPQRAPGLRWVQRNGLGDEGLIRCICQSVGWIDSGTLIYSRMRDKPGGESIYDLFTYSMFDDMETRLTNGEHIVALSPYPVSPNRVLLLRNGERGSNTLIEFDRRTGTRLILAEFSANHQMQSMAISPDERMIALSVWTRDRGDVLYLLEIETRNIEIIDLPSAKELFPAFSADGRFILFTSTPDGRYENLAFELATGDLYRISKSFAGSFAPTPSPDGQLLAYIDYKSAGNSLVSIPFDASSWELLDQRPVVSNIELADIHLRSEKQTAEPVSETQFQSYEIELFDLIPNSWVPILGPFNMGTYIFHTDPLNLFDYELSTGINLSPFQIFYDFSYHRFQTHSTLKLQLRGTPAFQRQVLSLEIPIFRSPSASRSIEIGLNRTAAQTEFFFSGFVRDLNGLDLFQRNSLLYLRGGIGSTIEGFIRRFELNWNERLRVPILGSAAGSHWLNVSTSAGWSDIADFRLGGLEGDTPLRGHQEVVRASQRISSSVTYEFPIAALRWACCMRHPLPFYVDTLRGSFFSDAGIIGNSLELDHLRIGVGFELQANIILGYGLVEGLMRFGIAYGLGIDEPQLYFSIDQSL